MKNRFPIPPIVRHILKGFPIILLSILFAVLIARKAVQYIPSTYEAVARIKLDESSYGVSSTNLFKDFDVFSVTSKIAAETALIRSNAILEKVVEKLNMDHSLFRVGKLKEIELDMDKPFDLNYKVTDQSWMGADIFLSIDEGNKCRLEANIGQEEILAFAQFGEQFTLPGLKLSLEKAKNKRGFNQKIDLPGRYRIRFHSPAQQTALLKSDKLDVKASEEEVPIIRIAFRHSSPTIAARTSNAIAEAYIEDQIAYKTHAASMTVNFIDKQIEEVNRSLDESEAALETYRNKEKVINTRQETETNLRKIAEMKIQLANIQMREAALDSLNQYINAGNKRFLDLAPSFEAFGDLLFTELLKQLKVYEAERIDLLTNYTEESRGVKALDLKISETVAYIKESIRNARKDITVKRASIQEAIADSETEFVGLPARERQMVILDREFQLNQKLYLFLSEKRMESAIQESASMSFHRIIDHATIPETPISPKPLFIAIVAGFLGLFLGLGIVILKESYSVRLKNPADLEKRSGIPVLGTVSQLKAEGQTENETVTPMLVRLLAQGKSKDHRYITFASLSHGEGKTFLSHASASLLGQMGRRTALITLESKKTESSYQSAQAIVSNQTPLLQRHTNGYDCFNIGPGSLPLVALLHHPNFESWWKGLTGTYEYILIDSTPFSENEEVLTLLQSSDLVLWVTRQGISRQYAADLPDELSELYDIPSIVHVVNGTQIKSFLGRPARNLRSGIQKLKASLSSFPIPKTLEN